MTEARPVTGLHDIAHVLQSADRSDERLLHSLELLRGIVPYDQCALLEARHGHQPRVIILPSVSPDERAQLTRRLANLFGKLIDSNVRWGDAAAPPDGRHLAVPLIGLDNVIGLLFVRRSVGEYTADDVRALSVAAAQFAAHLTMLSAGPMRGSEEPIGLAGATLADHRHVGAFFRDRDEADRVLLPFIKERFERGDRTFKVVNPEKREEHLRRLEFFGIRTRRAEDGGSFELRGWDQAQLGDGHFDRDKMLALVRDLIGGPPERPPNRIVLDMEGALENCPATNDLIEYEVRLNQALPTGKYSLVCSYALANFKASVILDVLRAHPMVLFGGVLQVNPFFVRPDQFLDELSRRESRGARV